MKIDFKDLKLDVQYLDINLIKPFARTSRTHSKEQMDVLWQHGIRVQGTARMHMLGKNLDSLIHWTCALLLSMLCVTKDNICGHLNVKSWF